MTDEELSIEEKAALEYAIAFPHCTLKSVLPKLFHTNWSSSLYTLHNKGRDSLASKGFLKDGNLTDLAFNALPPENLARLLKSLNSDVRRQDQKLFDAGQEIGSLNQENKCLKTENERLSRIEEQYRLINGITCTFDFLGIDENWISTLICSNILEQAVKNKLEELGCPVDENAYLNFDTLIQKLEKFLREKEKRSYDGLFQPQALRSIRNRMVHEGYRTKVSKDEANAVFVMTKSIIEQIRGSK